MSHSIEPPDRRTQMVQAAVRAFARAGFGGTTLADIAAEAGVSQPRISQVFGNKEHAFVEAHQYAAVTIQDHLRSLAGRPFNPQLLGRGYFELAREQREAVLVIFQGFSSSYVEAIARESRARFAEILALLVEDCGASAAQARDFIARGLVMHTAMAVGLEEHLDESSHFVELLGTLR